MVTSEKWWNKIKTSKADRDNWLKKQVYGEFRAHARIKALADQFKVPVLMTIADQELNHANWLKEYCEQNYVDLSDMNLHQERYWKEVKTTFNTLEEACAVGAHAEKMRLERITAIAKDTSDYPQLSAIFKKILKDELFHEKVFRSLAGDEEYENARDNHERGALALGLVS